MGDAEIVTLLISKMDDLKDDIKSVEAKIDKNTNQLNSFEVKATEVLTVHDCDITALKLRVDILDSELKRKDVKINEIITKESNKSAIVRLLDSNTFNYIFRGLILLLLSLILGADKLKILLPLLGAK